MNFFQSRFNFFYLFSVGFVLFSLITACCGNLTPEVVRFGKVYKNVITDYKSNVLALFIGLVCNLFFFVSLRRGIQNSKLGGCS